MPATGEGGPSPLGGFVVGQLWWWRIFLQTEIATSFTTAPVLETLHNPCSSTWKVKTANYNCSPGHEVIDKPRPTITTKPNFRFSIGLRCLFVGGDLKTIGEKGWFIAKCILHSFMKLLHNIAWLVDVDSFRIECSLHSSWIEAGWRINGNQNWCAFILLLM